MVFSGLLVVAITSAIGMFLLPGPKRCISALGCNRDFDSGAAPVLGHGNFTWPQTIIILGGLLVGAALVIMAAFPTRRDR